MRRFSASFPSDRRREFRFRRVDFILIIERFDAEEDVAFFDERARLELDRFEKTANAGDDFDGVDFGETAKRAFRFDVGGRRDGRK